MICISRRLPCRLRRQGRYRKASDIPAANVVPVDDWIDLGTVDLATGVRRLTNGRGADIVFDVVGGAMFEQCLSALTWRGRQVAISSSPEPRVNFKAGGDLTYPYLLVPIKNGGRIADWQLPHLEQSIRQSVEKSGSQLARFTRASSKALPGSLPPVE
jgi:NADPH:quinone reductase-like Zn-dependent oxidoreductase